MEKTAAEKAQAMVDAKQLSPTPVKVRGRALSFLRGPEVIDGNVHVWVSWKENGVEQVDDPHFVFVNPPVFVLKDGVPAEAPDEAFDVMVSEAVDRFLVKKGRQ